jgi:hypothetical protein
MPLKTHLTYNYAILILIHYIFNLKMYVSELNLKYLQTGKCNFPSICFVLVNANSAELIFTLFQFGN